MQLLGISCLITLLVHHPRLEGYRVTERVSCIDWKSKHFLAGLGTAASTEDRSGPAEDLVLSVLETWTWAGGVELAYREENCKDEAECGTDDLDMAWVLVFICGQLCILPMRG